MHSKVYKDNDMFVVLVDHSENLLYMSDMDALVGIMEYAVFDGEDALMVIDPNDALKVREVDDGWTGIDRGAVEDLLMALDQHVGFEELNENYVRMVRAQRKGASAKEVLAAESGEYPPLGTVIRIEYGFKEPELADVLTKIGLNEWVACGQITTWSDDDIAGYDYEVIYSV